MANGFGGRCATGLHHTPVRQIMSRFWNVPMRERVIVTIKQQTFENPIMFKIIGPNNSIELRKIGNLKEFAVPFRNGAKEIRATAYLNPKGRWHLVEVVPPAGLEPATSASTAQRSTPELRRHIDYGRWS